jgi:hypothetical protein
MLIPVLCTLITLIVGVVGVSFMLLCAYASRKDALRTDVERPWWLELPYRLLVSDRVYRDDLPAAARSTRPYAPERIPTRYYGRTVETVTLPGDNVPS